jgi:hypothetical protein
MRIAFLSRGGCHSSLTAADREHLEGLARFVFAESPCPSRKGVIYSRHRLGNPTPIALLSDAGTPRLVSAAGFWSDNLEFERQQERGTERKGGA